MNRNTLIVSLVLAIMLAIVGTAQGPSTSASEVTGRFQLFSGEHSVTTSKGTYTEKAILRLDRQTGTVHEWVYFAGSDHKLHNFWSAISETP